MAVNNYGTGGMYVEIGTETTAVNIIASGHINLWNKGDDEQGATSVQLKFNKPDDIVRLIIQLENLKKKMEGVKEETYI